MSVKRERFVDLAEKRVTKALKSIQLIGNLSNKSNYEYTTEDVHKIQKALNKALEDMRNKFNNSNDMEHTVFKL